MTELGKNKGFTLIELAIVIVIIGLIVLAIISGTHLIRESKIKKVISEYEQFGVAENTFKLKYSALPGDMADATSYGFQGNGNGDKVIMSRYNSGNGHDDEYVMYWSHLGQLGAQLLPARYDSSGFDPAFPDTILQKALPLSAIGAYWSRKRITPLGQFGNIYVLGAYHSQWGYYGVKDSMSPGDAYSLDKKVDDSKPATGIIRAAGYYSPVAGVYTMGGSTSYNNPTYAQTATSGNCTANGAASYDSTAQYNVAYNEITCLPMILKR